MSAHVNATVLAVRPWLPHGTKILVREGTSISARDLPRGRLRVAAYRYLYRKADLVLCQSEAMRRDMILRYGVSTDKAARIYNPVDIDLISSLASAEPPPFSTPGPNLVAVGRLEPVKHYELLLACMPAVLRHFPECKLTIVGDGSLERALRRQCADMGLSGSVRFAGLHANPYPYLKCADLLVLTSRYEGLPNVVLEALALGTSVVATDCSGALHEIAATTTRLHIVPDRTTAALATCICEVLRRNDPVRPAGGEPAFRSRFELQRVIAEYERLFAPLSTPNGQEPKT
jgi:glycosyltransferase involved in cell wall biosynthesis